MVEEQNRTLNNIASFLIPKKDIIDLIDGFMTMVSEARFKEAKRAKGKGIKLLIPKQMRQRFSIALSQLKTKNTSGSFLNEIIQIAYSLY